MKKIFFILTAAMAFLFTGCQGEEDLKGVWKAEKVIYEGAEKTSDTCFLQFEKQGAGYSLSGNAGVNVVNGTVILKNGNIEVGNLAMTRMMGDPVSQDFEDSFMQILMNAESYELESDSLTVTDKAKNKIVFRK